MWKAGGQAFNLAESTVRSLGLHEVLALVEAEGGLDGLALDYGNPAGSEALRAAIADNTGVMPDTVVSLPGTMFGLFLLAPLICAQGEEAVLLTPCYKPMQTVLERAGVAFRAAALRFEDGYAPDIGRIAQALRPETRLVCLADPHNPSGVRMPDGAITALLVEMARRCPKALLFIDETYREATHGGPAPPSAASLDPRIVTSGSLSKAHGAPGLRAGWMTLHDTALRRRLIAAKEALILSGSVLDEALAVVLLRRSDLVLGVRRQALADALAAVLRWQKSVDGLVEMVRPDAGALCCMRLRPGVVDDAGVTRFWSALPAHKLRLAPGPWFGEVPRVFRLGFGHLALPDLLLALRALSQVLEIAT